MIVFVRQVIFLFNVRYIAKAEAFRFIQVSVTNCANQCKKICERILYVCENFVIIIKYRTRQLHWMFNSLAFSFQQRCNPLWRTERNHAANVFREGEQNLPSLYCAFTTYCVSTIKRSLQKFFWYLCSFNLNKLHRKLALS